MLLTKCPNCGRESLEGTAVCQCGNMLAADQGVMLPAPTAPIKVQCAAPECNWYVTSHGAKPPSYWCPACEQLFCFWHSRFCSCCHRAFCETHIVGGVNRTIADSFGAVDHVNEYFCPTCWRQKRSELSEFDGVWERKQPFSLRIPATWGLILSALGMTILIVAHVSGPAVVVGMAFLDLALLVLVLGE